MSATKRRLIALDFDGTLFSTKGGVCSLALAELRRIERDVVRVIATGRNYTSISSALSFDFPIDYLVAGSGGYTMAWPSKDLLHVASMSRETALGVARQLLELQSAFFVLSEPPHSHIQWGYPGNDPPADYFNRWNRYKESASLLPDGDIVRSEGVFSDHSHFSQLIVVCADASAAVTTKDALRRTALPLNIVDTTSPYDHKTPWVEVLPQGMSKEEALQRIATLHDLQREDCVAVGNDFNDLGMLRWASRSYVVRNAPLELQREFQTTKGTCEEGGVAEVLRQYT